MNISILTVFPQLYDSFLNTSLVARAQSNKLVSISTHDFFSYVEPKERIDTQTFGHGSGMLLRPDVIQKAIEDREKVHGKAFRIFLSPQGKKLNQKLLRKLRVATQNVDHVMLVASRYEGIDDRVEQHYADETISVGDFIVMGGDIPAMLFLEGFLRLIPGVVGKQESVEHESFSGPFLDYPEYAPPVEWQGMHVPDIVRSGDHGKLHEWRMDQAIERSVKHHFEWVRSSKTNKSERALIQKKIPHHYVALLHSEVLIGKEKAEGTTSVTSLDIHDIARSAMTYGLQGFSIVTPLHDQQQMVTKILSFWQGGAGQIYNAIRCRALKLVVLQPSLQDVIDDISKKEGVAPLIIATSAREEFHHKKITFYDQEAVWGHDRPVLFIFGTGQGLSPDCIKKADLLLPPLEGFGEFNHLSVRSAAAIIFDKWLGLNEKTV